jgi:hypothetical protein
MKTKLMLCAASGALLLSGCAGFRARQLPEVAAQDLRATPAVKTKVYSNWVMGNDGPQNAQALLKNSKTQFEKALERSDCCTVVNAAAEADVVVEGKVFDEQSQLAMIPALITGFSLYAIPSWVTANVHLTATAKRGDTLRSYELQDKMTMVQWLPMIVVLPFTGNPIKAETQMVENAYNNLVVNIKKDGLIR